MARKRNTTKATASDKVEATESAEDTTAAEMAAIEKELSEVDESVSSDSSDELDNEVGAEIEATEGREESFKAEKDESGDDASEETKGGATKGRSRSVSTSLEFPQNVLALFSDEELVLDAEKGPIDSKELATRLDSVTQKKVKEKVHNLLQAAKSGASPSAYTQIALKVAKAAADKGEAVTSSELKQAYRDAGYRDGTAAAQAGQMFAMFPVLEIAVRNDRGTMTPNANSVLLDGVE